MMTLGFIKHFVALHDEIAYILMIIGVLIEGEFVAIIAAVFAYLKSLNIIFVFLAVILGGAGKTVIGYSIGYYLQKHHSHREFLKNIENKVNKFLPSLKERPFISSLASWFLILGIKWFSLIYSGYRQINIRQFIKTEIPSLFIWAGTVISFGYFFSYTALSISHDVHKLSIILLILFVAFFLFEKVFAFIILLLNTSREAVKNLME